MKIVVGVTDDCTDVHLKHLQEHVFFLGKTISSKLPGDLTIIVIVQDAAILLTICYLL